MTTSNETIQHRRFLISGGVGALLGVGGLVAVTLADHNTHYPTSGTLMMAQLGPPTGGGAPGAGPGTPGGGTATPAKPPRKFPTSFDGDPSGGAGATTPAGGGGGFGGPVAPATGGTGGGATPPKPVVKGASADKYRPDPFVSFRFLPAEKTPPYTFISTARFAKYPDPPKPKADPDPNIEFGPLPFVPRRVAGILYNGSTSAILETAGADYRIIAPGTKVPSGIAGLRDLTVSAITPTQVTLRADDGRSVSVSLSASPTGTPSIGGGAGFGGGAPGGGFGGGAPGGGGGARGGNND